MFLSPWYMCECSKTDSISALGLVYITSKLIMKWCTYIILDLTKVVVKPEGHVLVVNLLMAVVSFTL